MTEQEIRDCVVDGVKNIYDVTLTKEDIVVVQTMRDVEGDYTIVTFPVAKKVHIHPKEIAEALGEYFMTKGIYDYTVVQGFLNIKLNART